MSPRISFIIAGAGLGGLATAIGLRRAGHQVTVLEKAPGLAEVHPTPSLTLETANNIKITDWSRNQSATKLRPSLQRMGSSR